MPAIRHVITLPSR